jgi:ribosomal protein S18 acetylase RimI-like enzyme
MKIANVYLAARKEFVSFAPLIHSDDSIYKWILEKLIPTDQLIVAVEDESIIGIMVLSKNEGIGWIDQLYISPVAVGRGVGTLLVIKAKSILGSPVRLHTFQENDAARRFYEKHGFQIVEFSDGSKNEENCPDMLYEWRL